MAVLKKIISKHLKSGGKSLLDVACGTGLEDRYLKHDFDITGIDLNDGVLRIARRRNQDVEYLHGDMRRFKLDRKFDIIICFDAMCYLQNYRELHMTLFNFYKHLVHGGLLVFYLDDFFLREHSRQDAIVVNRKTKGNKAVFLFEIYHRRRNRVEGHAIYVIMDGKNTRFELDTFETLGFFEVIRIKKILKDIGFRTYCYKTGQDITFTLKAYDGIKHCPVFVCETRLSS